MKKLALFILTSLLIFNTSSCKKKECPGPTAFDYLVQDEWVYDKIEIYVNDVLTNTNNLNGWHRVFAPSGDYFVFNAQNQTTDYGTFTLDDDSDPMTLRLKVYSSNTPVEYIVDKLDEEELIFYREELVGSDVYRYVYYHFRN